MASQHFSKFDESVEDKYYPSPISRKEPDWITWLALGDKKESDLSRLLKEVYQAVYGGQNRPAAMAIRALLEQVMILKVGLRSIRNSMHFKNRVMYR
jgi:hypothetical protein